ncbi:MAG: hypothetical protein ABI629_00555 [bacterium]
MRTDNAKGSATRLSTAILAASLILLGSAAGVSAQVSSSDTPAGYVVLPKVVVHTTGGDPAVANPGGTAIDTIIQITNVNQAEEITVDCWWVNANKHCGTDTGAICTTAADCSPGLQCVQGWAVLDFQVMLTPGQPIGFLASSGLNPVPCDPIFPGPGCIGTAGGAVRPVPEDPFQGELKCLQVDENDIPVVQNDLKIEATIVSTTVGGGTSTTAAAYNGVGFEALSAGTEAPDDPICLGGLPLGSTASCAGTYAPCPSVLHLEHFFDGAPTELGGVVSTDLTLVPCSENLGEPSEQANLSVTANMLVYNEFEQRLSTNTRVQCYQATRLVDIDTPPGAAGDVFSVFWFGVQGTLTGQTRIRGIQGPQGELGYGLTGVACESYSASIGSPVVAKTASNLQHVGFREGGDAVFRTEFPAGPQVP